MSDLNRRDFLKVVGVTGAASAVGCDPTVPIENVLPYVVQPAQLVPGIATWISTQCNECSSGCGIVAKNREGRVINVQGNPDNPVVRAPCVRSDKREYRRLIVRTVLLTQWQPVAELNGMLFCPIWPGNCRRAKWLGLATPEQGLRRVGGRVHDGPRI